MSIETHIHNYCKTLEIIMTKGDAVVLLVVFCVVIASTWAGLIWKDKPTVAPKAEPTKILKVEYRKDKLGLCYAVITTGTSLEPETPPGVEYRVLHITHVPDAACLGL